MIGVTFKQGVDFTNISRVIWFAVSVAAAVYEDYGATEIVVTSGRDGQHKPNSKHYENPGRAVDLRIWNLEQKHWAEATKRIGNVLGSQFFVLLEPKHIHIQYNGAD